MATSRDEKKLREVWEGWHTISPPMRKDYARFVDLSNKGAKELGFDDTGAMWRAKYDMPPISSRWSSIGCGRRSGRSMCSCTPTSG